MSLVDSVAIQFAARKPPRRPNRNPGNAAQGAANENVGRDSILRIGFNHPHRAINLGPTYNRVAGCPAQRFQRNLLLALLGAAAASLLANSPWLFAHRNDDVSQAMIEQLPLFASTDPFTFLIDYLGAKGYWTFRAVVCRKGLLHCPVDPRRGRTPHPHSKRTTRPRHHARFGQFPFCSLQPTSACSY
jgi:hypothetical protein